MKNTNKKSYNSPEISIVTFTTNDIMSNKHKPAITFIGKYQDI